MSLNNIGTPRPERLSSKEIVRQELFLQMVAKEVLTEFVEEFKDALYDEGVTDHGQIETVTKEFMGAFAELSEEDKNAVLAIPFELRTQRLAQLAKQAIKGSHGEELLLSLRDGNKKTGSTLGYHMSPIDIVQPEQGKQWVVKGTGEHVWEGNPDKGTDPTGPMAFYSLDYINRYLKKPAPYLYVVVGKVIDGQGHGKSNSGTWGHAPTLDIIQKVDMLDIEKRLDARMKEIDGKQEREAA